MGAGSCSLLFDHLGYGSPSPSFCYHCQRAKLHTGIKPTALCSVLDKENLTKFSLDSVHYLYMKSYPNPFFYPMLPYESLFSHVSIDKKDKIK